MAILLPGMFGFATPPRTGVYWFVHACREAELMLIPNKQAVLCSLYPWQERSENILRVSLVRHPCDWLRSVYDTICGRDIPTTGIVVLAKHGFISLPRTSFEQFVTQYLEVLPGKITELQDSYKADSRLRLEDMPWALVELLETLSIKQEKLDCVIKLPKQHVAKKRAVWKQKHYDAVLKEEQQFCEALDYY